MIDSQKLGQVAEKLHGPLARFADLVHELFGAGLKSVTLFGPATTQGFDVVRENAWTVLVVDRVDLHVLRQLAEHGTSLGRSGIKAPLIMTPKQIAATRDTFPLELLEIQQQHLTLLGDDFFNALEFETIHVRLQCERELKTMLIAMRQGLISAAGREADVAAMEIDVGRGLLRVLRGLLWLRGEKNFVPRANVLDKVETMIGQKLPGVRTAHETSSPHGWAEFDLLYHDLERLGEFANAW